MKKYISLLLLTQFLFSNNINKIMIKVKEKETINIKVLIRTNIINREIAKIKNIDPYFIRKVELKEGNFPISTIYLNDYVSDSFVLKLHYKHSLNNNIKLLITDTNNKTYTKTNYIKTSVKNDNFNKEKVYVFKKIDSRIWDAQSSSSAIKLLYGDKHIQKGDFLK